MLLSGGVTHRPHERIGYVPATARQQPAQVPGLAQYRHGVRHVVHGDIVPATADTAGGQATNCWPHTVRGTGTLESTGAHDEQ